MARDDRQQNREKQVLSLGFYTRETVPNELPSGNHGMTFCRLLKVSRAVGTIFSLADERQHLLAKAGGQSVD